MRIRNLETWAGPGQGALAAGQQGLRADLAKVRQTQAEHTRLLADLAKIRETQAEHTRAMADLARIRETQADQTLAIGDLKTEVATLKTDTAEIRDAVRMILRRLPPLPADPSANG